MCDLDEDQTTFMSNRCIIAVIFSKVSQTCHSIVRCDLDYSKIIHQQWFFKHTKTYHCPFVFVFGQWKMTESCLHREDTIKSSNSTCPRFQRERPSQQQNSGSTRSVWPGPSAMRHSYLACSRWLGNIQKGKWAVKCKNIIL